MQAILTRRSLSSREARITCSTNLAETRNITTFTELLKDLTHMLPIFYGTDEPKLGKGASKFIEWCMVAKDNLGEIGSIVEFLKCIRTRLFGNAYTYLHNNNFIAIEVLCQAIKGKFIRTQQCQKIRSKYSTASNAQRKAHMNLGKG